MKTCDVQSGSTCLFPEDSDIQLWVFRSCSQVPAEESSILCCVNHWNHLHLQISVTSSHRDNGAFRSITTTASRFPQRIQMYRDRCLCLPCHHFPSHYIFHMELPFPWPWIGNRMYSPFWVLQTLSMSFQHS